MKTSYIKKPKHTPPQKLWANAKEMEDFINAIREVLRKSPIPWSRGRVEPYSGVTVYGTVSGKTSSGGAAEWHYEALR